MRFPLVFALIFAMMFLLGCNEITVQSGDTSPPSVEVHFTPDSNTETPVYQDGTPFSNPVDVNRPINLTLTGSVTTGSPATVRINVIGRDIDSGIESIQVTLNNRVNCSGRFEPGLEQSWESTSILSDSRSSPDPDGSQTSPRGNLILPVQLRNYWLSAECFKEDVDSGEQREIDEGFANVLPGTYTAVVCNNSGGSRAQKCTTVTGEYNVIGDARSRIRR